MEVYEAIEKRRTIRDFEDRPIPPEVLERIISAGLKAPSNNHLRQWEFIVCQDASDKKRLVEAIPFTNNVRDIDRMLDGWGMTDQDQRYTYQEAVPKQHSMIIHAAVVILPCFLVTNPLLKPGTLSDLNYFASIWCCIENMLLAATAEECLASPASPLNPSANGSILTWACPKTTKYPVIYRWATRESSNPK